MRTVIALALVAGLVACKKEKVEPIYDYPLPPQDTVLVVKKIQPDTLVNSLGEWCQHDRIDTVHVGGPFRGCQWQPVIR